jgi:hypothetical protein
MLLSLLAIIDIIDFFKRHPEIYSMFSRFIDCGRVNAENNFDTFIDWFRRFNDIKRKWDIIDSDIYNMDESDTSLGAESFKKKAN